MTDDLASNMGGIMGGLVTGVVALKTVDIIGRMAERGTGGERRRSSRCTSKRCRRR